MGDRAAKVAGLEVGAAVRWMLDNPLDYNDLEAGRAEAKLFLGVVAKITDKQIDDLVAGLSTAQASLLFDQLNRGMQEIAEGEGLGNSSLRLYNKLLEKKGSGLIAWACSRKCMVKRRINKFP